MGCVNLISQECTSWTWWRQDSVPPGLLEVSFFLVWGKRSPPSFRRHWMSAELGYIWGISPTHLLYLMLILVEKSNKKMNVSVDQDEKKPQPKNVPILAAIRDFLWWNAHSKWALALALWSERFLIACFQDPLTNDPGRRPWNPSLEPIHVGLAELSPKNWSGLCRFLLLPVFNSMSRFVFNVVSAELLVGL